MSLTIVITSDNHGEESAEILYSVELSQHSSASVGSIAKIGSFLA